MLREAQNSFSFHLTNICLHTTRGHAEADADAHGPLFTVGKASNWNIIASPAHSFASRVRTKRNSFPIGFAQPSISSHCSKIVQAREHITFTSVEKHIRDTMCEAYRDNGKWRGESQRKKNAIGPHLKKRQATQRGNNKKNTKFQSHKNSVLTRTTEDCHIMSPNISICDCSRIEKPQSCVLPPKKSY